MSKIEIIKPGPITGLALQPDTSALRRGITIPSKTRSASRSKAKEVVVVEDATDVVVEKTTPAKRKSREAPRLSTNLFEGDVVQMFGYAGLGILALYAYKSYTDGGVDVDGSGQKRNLFRWVDAACGALIGVALFRFARTMY